MSKKIKILVTASTFPRNEDDSAPRFVLDLCKSLQLQGDIDCHVLAPHLKGAATEEILEGVHVIRYTYAYPSNLEKISGEGIVSKLKYNPMLLLLLPSFLISQIIHTVIMIHKLKPDIILSNWLIPQGLVTLIAGLVTKSTARLLVCHGGDIAVMRGNLLLRMLGRYVLKHQDGVIAVSNYLKTEIEDKIIHSESNIKVISMGVDIPKFNTVSHHCFPIGYPVEYILFIGRIEEKKGLAYLLDAIAAMTDNELRVPLVVIGSGTLKNEMEQKAMSLGLLNSKVYFKGAVPHNKIPSILRNAIVCVFPSINTQSDSEGLPTVILESIAAKTPVITTDAGGITDIIINGVTGLIVKQQDSVALANAIVKLLSNEILRKEIADNAYRHVCDNYSYGAISSKFRTEIDRLLLNRHGVS